MDKLRIFTGTRAVEPQKHFPRIADILGEMEPAAAADLLNDLAEDRSEEILEEMKPDEKEDVEELLEFREDTAGGLMNLAFLALPEAATVAEAISALREKEEILEDLHSVFLVDAEDHLLHTVPVAKLFFAPCETPLRELASDQLLSVQDDEKQDRIAEMFDKYNLLTLPVVDHNGRLIGVIKVDDIVALLRQK